MIKAIFFDFNGVIIDDEILQMQAYQELLRDREIELTEEQYFAALGMDDRTFLRTAYQRAGKPLSDELLSELMTDKTARHRKLIEDELPLLPGATTFIKAAARDFSLGLVSMANTDEIDYVLDRARLRPFFSIIVNADVVHVCKPAPDCYHTAIELLNGHLQEQRKLPVLPSECLAIEDAPQGIQAARNAGMRTLGVTNTVSETDLRQADADIVTSSLADWTMDTVRHVFG